MEQIAAMAPAIQAQVAQFAKVFPSGVPQERPQEARSVPKATSASPKARKGRRVPRTRNGGAWTEAQYWQVLRSGLRRLYRFWGPAKQALLRARVRYPGRHGAKWAFRCEDCGKLFRRAGVEIDHIEPAGSLTDLSHVADFIRRLTPEDPAAFKIRCLRCHDIKTGQERQARKPAAIAAAKQEAGSSARSVSGVHGGVPRPQG